MLISHEKWKMLNHNLPEMDPHKALEFSIGEQRYLTIPVERVPGLGNVVQATRETGLTIITRKRSSPNG